MTQEKESIVPNLVHNSLNGVIRFGAFRHLYTEPDDALQDFHKRRKDVALKEMVRKNLGASAEGILKMLDQPHALFFRQIATPTHETLRFLKCAKEMGLKPLILEYYEDKFVSSENRSKRLLGKMPIYQYTGSDGRDMVQYETVCDFNSSTGKTFNEITCFNGEGLIHFHHRLFQKNTGLNPKTCCFDASEWFRLAGDSADEYYEPFFTLFIRDAVLFENFMPLRSENAFTKTVIIPTFEKLKKQYGVAPIIVRLLPENEEMRLFWDSYPRKIKKYPKNKSRSMVKYISMKVRNFLCLPS
ncbi:MAG: hypothetical protein WC887_02515 [Candidatus Paceibacterota bacterium]|jgi:hypothetical protein